MYDQLADTVRWVVPGQPPVEGKTAVLAACVSAAAEFRQLSGTDVLRFVSVADDRAAAIDRLEGPVAPLSGARHVAGVRGRSSAP